MLISLKKSVNGGYVMFILGCGMKFPDKLFYHVTTETPIHKPARVRVGFEPESSEVPVSEESTATTNLMVATPNIDKYAMSTMCSAATMITNGPMTAPWSVCEKVCTWACQYPFCCSHETNRPMTAIGLCVRKFAHGHANILSAKPHNTHTTFPRHFHTLINQL